MSAAKPSVLIVGAGLTGSLLSHRLREKAFEVTVWEKSRGPGGRACTLRRGDAQFDAGLQYLTSNVAGDVAPFYEKLLAERTIIPLEKSSFLNPPSRYNDPAAKNYAAVEGASNLAKNFLSPSTAVSYETEVNALHVVSNNGKQQWRVTTKDGREADFDKVVLSAPVPQILALSGDVQSKIDASGLRDDLESVKYSSRWAVMAELPAAAWGAAAAMGGVARYFSKDEDAVVCYAAIDNAKRGKAARDGGGPAVVLHANVPWSLDNGAALAKEEEPAGLRKDVEREILGRAQTLLPDLFSLPPVATYCHKWRFSQVHVPAPGQPGALTLCESPLLVAAGDGLIGSNFDNCVASSGHAANLLASSL